MSNHEGSAPNWLNADYLLQVLQKNWPQRDPKIQNIEISPASGVGDNYACQIFRIVVDFTEQNEGSNTISLIAKYKPATDWSKEMDKSLDYFTVEVNFFEVLQPLINEVLASISPNTESLTPLCYHVDNVNKVIIMEDLKKRGYLLQKRGELLNLRQLELCVEAIANFHGATIKILEKQPELADKFGVSMWGSSISDAFMKIVINACECIQIHMDKYELDDKYVKKLNGLKEEMENGRHKVFDKKDGDLNVLAHGDCWQNNMLFHFQNGSADKVVLLDFQVIQHTSFAVDLQYFLSLAADATTLVNNIDYLLEVYYKQLLEFCPNVDFQRIKNEFFEKRYIGFMMAVLFRPFIVAETPMNLENIIHGKGREDDGFKNKTYINDLKILMPYFDKNGWLD